MGFSYFDLCLVVLISHWPRRSSTCRWRRVCLLSFAKFPGSTHLSPVKTCRFHGYDERAGGFRTSTTLETAIERPKEPKDGVQAPPAFDLESFIICRCVVGSRAYRLPRIRVSTVARRIAGGA